MGVIVWKVQDIIIISLANKRANIVFAQGPVIQII